MNGICGFMGAVSGVLWTAARLPSAVTRTRNGRLLTVMVGTVGLGLPEQTGVTAMAATVTTIATGDPESRVSSGSPATLQRHQIARFQPIDDLDLIGVAIAEVRARLGAIRRVRRR